MNSNEKLSNENFSLSTCFSENEKENFYFSQETKKFSYFFGENNENNKKKFDTENFFDSIYFFEYNEVISENKKNLNEIIRNYITKRQQKINSSKFYGCKKLRSNSCCFLKYEDIISFKKFNQKLRKIKKECFFDFFYIIEFLKNSLEKQKNSEKNTVKNNKKYKINYFY